MTKSQSNYKWKQANRKRLNLLLKPKFSDAISSLAEKCGKSKNQFVIDAIVFYTKYFELMGEEELEAYLSN